MPGLSSCTVKLSKIFKFPLSNTDKYIKLWGVFKSLVLKLHYVIPRVILMTVQQTLRRAREVKSRHF